MRRLIVALMLPLSLGGCFSYTAPPPRSHTTVVVPQGSQPAACPNGSAPPC